MQNSRDSQSIIIWFKVNALFVFLQSGLVGLNLQKL